MALTPKVKRTTRKTTSNFVSGLNSSNCTMQSTPPIKDNRHNKNPNIIIKFVCLKNWLYHKKSKAE
jgi:hypothetical protein